MSGVSHLEGGLEPSLLSMDEWVQMARGSNGFFPGWPSAKAILLAGMPFYSLPVLAILSPTYLDRLLKAEWFEGDASGGLYLTLVNMGFMAMWGPATFLIASWADVVGRRPALLAVTLAVIRFAVVD